MNRSAVFSCKGLGDGLIALILAHQLSEKKRDVEFFHPFLSGLQQWFPSVKISPFPEISTLSQFDSFYLFYEKSPWMEGVRSFCETRFPDKTFVLNPIATPRRDYPYWSVGAFDGTLPFAHNLALFCERHLEQPASTLNGIQIPKEVTPRKFPMRIVLHPTSSRAGKNWPREKFLTLAKQLTTLSYEPVFILTEEERKEWGELPFSAPRFFSLDEIARFVAESGKMVGNDSGIGHLASCLGLPTVTICRSPLAARFWRPGWAPGEVVLPPWWLPNLKGFRLRDRYWKLGISVNAVLKHLTSLKD